MVSLDPATGVVGVVGLETVEGTSAPICKVKELEPAEEERLRS